MQQPQRQRENVQVSYEGRMVLQNTSDILYGVLWLVVLQKKIRRHLGAAVSRYQSCSCYKTGVNQCLY